MNFRLCSLCLLLQFIFLCIVNSTFANQDGPSAVCKTWPGEAGSCVRLADCPADRRGTIPKFCSVSRRFELRVCCKSSVPASSLKKKSVPAPNINFAVPASSLKKKSVPAPNINFECGKRKTFRIRLESPFSLVRRKRSHVVVGGVISEENSWPWMVLLGTKQGSRIKFFCSGVLISQNFVLTAAHCILEPVPIFARFGEHDRTKPALGSIEREDINVADVIVHPKYKLGIDFHDTALLKLGKPVKFRDGVSPVCLPWGSHSNKELAGEQVTITGWGSEQFGRSVASPVLREVEVMVFDPSRCQKSYSTLIDFKEAFPGGLSWDNIICAGTVNGGKDSCQGDSGGPIVHRGSNNVYTLAGIISKGHGCGKPEFPGLYAPVRDPETLRWIKEVAF